jgi:hypothetical protein
MQRMERMQLKGAVGPPVYCSAHMQGRGWAASYGDYCTAQAAESINRRLKVQRKAEAGVPPVHIQPIPELDLRRLISSKVASSCLSLPPTAHVVVAFRSALDPPAGGTIRPRPRTRAARYAYTFQCSRRIQLNSYCMPSLAEDPSTSSRLSI